ncbi:glycoside hydrolase family 6 protein [Winogradskya humida]|uniref:Glucanase n=1 Tax=Winogradskya humida TaxID=113566 RepID=A0ABQ4A2K3_9ACTN|nr:glycoside hydrolase family 6 protein [Actinoplanes humidus]GIE25082.1 glucanase [Actinoplanes humidus]
MRKSITVSLVAAVAAACVAAVPLLSADAATASPLAQTTGGFADPKLPAMKWVTAHPTDGRAATIRANIATQPMAHWFTGTSDPDIGAAVAKYTGTARSAGNKLPVLVAYNLPGRDACGAESAGGAATVAAYQTWISTFAAAIGSSPAIVVLEPDSLGDFECMTAAQIATRTTLLNFATRMFAEKAPNTWAYLDAGNANWGVPATMAARLKASGVTRVRGFSVNVSNFVNTTRSKDYAAKIKAALGTSAGYLVDTSRNGDGYNGEWCNPAGPRIGRRSTADPAALELWIKNPGNSDGTCGIAPSTPAGTFDPNLAQRLITGA